MFRHIRRCLDKNGPADYNDSITCRKSQVAFTIYAIDETHEAEHITRKSHCRQLVMRVEYGLFIWTVRVVNTRRTTHLTANYSHRTSVTRTRRLSKHFPFVNSTTWRSHYLSSADDRRAIPIYLTPPTRDPVFARLVFQQENCNTFHPTLMRTYCKSRVEFDIIIIKGLASVEYLNIWVGCKM